MTTLLEIKPTTTNMNNEGPYSIRMQSASIAQMLHRVSDGDLLDSIKKILAKAGADASGSPEAAKEKASEEAKADPFAPFEMARQAVDRHRTTVKWVVSAYAAIWTVLVGTAPFAGLGDLDDVGLLIAGGGLLLAGIGALTGVYAASRVLEPEDSSLGELAQPPGEGPGWLAELIEGSGQDTARKQRDKLFKSEPGYFGTDSRTTTADLAKSLIGAIQDAERALWEAEDAAARAPENDRPGADREVEAAGLKYERLGARRNLTLAVAAIYEVRGKYWASRRLLIIGAALVLVGTLTYLSQVVAESDSESDTAATAAPPSPAAVTPVQIRMKSETWRSLNTPSGGTRCFTPNLGQEDKAVVNGYALGDLPTVGPWTVVALPNGTGVACRPVTFVLKVPAGRVVPAATQHAEPANKDN